MVIPVVRDDHAVVGEAFREPNDDPAPPPFTIIDHPFPLAPKHGHRPNSGRMTMPPLPTPYTLSFPLTLSHAEIYFRR
jgi:hypothetical protein